MEAEVALEAMIRKHRERWSKRMENVLAMDKQIFMRAYIFLKQCLSKEVKEKAKGGELTEQERESKLFCEN
eukprot:CAMPEP_0168609506 /NCGR_PEP_ID=MMETSP0449_2-20121227/1246_1 /TAXON_ID=1082188 /ORGANISM="Strombidium rassoulzadegani, Strain ras09" /LENGTH=70 /DNA_ID=CAMNT_0008649661 /DNA_START=350 /DNA_END=562 /DNA_ORIENTATION=+